MPRRARVIIPNTAHHIIQRGNNRQNVFLEESDYSNYCFWVNKYAEKYHVNILAYCLMTNHVHFIVVPKDKIGISKLFSAAHMRHAQVLNHKRKTSGHLWQGRFFSCVMDEEHLYYAIRYVEQNPVRAGMVRFPWDYSYSSAKRHVGGRTETFIKIEDINLVKKGLWKEYLLNTDADQDEQIRKTTNMGKAAADEKYISLWERKFKCKLRILKPGRRPKKKK